MRRTTIFSILAGLLITGLAACQGGPQDLTTESGESPESSEGSAGADEDNEQSEDEDDPQEAPAPPANEPGAVASATAAFGVDVVALTRGGQHFWAVQAAAPCDAGQCYTEPTILASTDEADNVYVDALVDFATLPVDHAFGGMSDNAELRDSLPETATRPVAFVRELSWSGEPNDAIHFVDLQTGYPICYLLLTDRGFSTGDEVRFVAGDDGHPLVVVSETTLGPGNAMPGPPTTVAFSLGPHNGTRCPRVDVP